MKINYDINLTPYQWDFCNSPKRYRIVIASTKVGKTHACMSYIVKRALEDESQGIYWWVAPIYGQAKIAFRRIRRMLSKYPVFTVNKSEMSITMPNKSQIYFKSADNPDSLYGEGVNFVVFDEFTRSTLDSWVSLRSTLTETKGDAILIGNYTGDSNWGVQLKEKAEEEDSAYGYWKLTAWDAVEAGILDEDEVNQAAKDLPEPIYRALYLAEGGFSPDTLVMTEQINDIFTNTHVKPTGQYTMTADIAMQGKDKLVIGIWNGYILEKVIVKHKSNGKKIEDLIRNLKNGYKIPNSRIVYDAIGIGNYLIGYFKDSVPFNGSKKALGSRKTFANRRSQVLYELAQMINKGEILVTDTNYINEIKRELTCLKIENWEGGKDITIIDKKKMKQIIGHSPDFLDMMALRLFLDIYPKLNNFNNEINN